jgi:predicted CXXCH cytochrome family protein
MKTRPLSNTTNERMFAGMILLILLITLAAATTSPARAQISTGGGTSEECLACHSKPDLSITLPSGETLSLTVSGEAFGQSVHGKVGIECLACHADFKDAHPKQSYQNHREFSRAYYQTCEKCHAANYDKTLDSMHAQVAASGNMEAPVCTDCHGAHDTQAPDQPRALISETCGQCHTNIFQAYKDSVHGSALIVEDNQDVPVCTDCHGVHNIHDPRTAQFRVDSPELCAHCHADEKLMAKYNLPANVYNIYKLSWHGVDVSVYEARWPTIWHQSAVCTDCHGVHDIRKTSDPASKVNSANLLGTCQKCHPGAGPNWTGAWTGHNEISLERRFCSTSNSSTQASRPLSCGCRSSMWSCKSFAP